MSRARATKPAAEVVRCAWTGIADPLYQRYHDEEWGVPLTDETRLFEKLVLEGFQSGLSWLTILRKRDNFRAAFAGFAPERVAAFGARDVARLVADAGIIRHRGKIEAAIGNARAYIALAERTATRAPLLDFVRDAAGPLEPTPPRLSMADVPSQTEASRRLSKALKSAGFRFVGPTTVYAFMQSTGMVNDHLAGCHRHAACAQLQKRSATRRT